MLTLTILSQWPRFRSERDFFRYADAHWRKYFPNLLGHGQLNRRNRALEPELRALQQDLPEILAEPSGAALYHVLDTTLIRYDWKRGLLNRVVHPLCIHLADRATCASPRASTPQHSRLREIQDNQLYF